MNINFRFDKRIIILAGTAVVAAGVFFIFIRPLWTDVSLVAQEAKVLNDDLSQIRLALQQGKDLNNVGGLITRGQVSLAINEFMEAAAELDVDVISTSPQQIQHLESSKYPVLPIKMELKSKYENFAKFLGALENMNQSIVTVQQFNIDRNHIIFPEIIVELVVEVHLKEGKGG